MKDWVDVFKSSNAIDAEMVKAMLVEQGIDAVVINKMDSSRLFFGTVSVFVKAEDAEQAKHLIATPSAENHE
ncbi:MAG: DUF2007 domain-containing protein [Bacteroidia bacterium]|nr:DUF2007 domain-containing protein [Bacteroidia bacterium]MCF8428336.1 DUF2007 domain-containing protein [Bacteroidia bacterium]